MAKQRNYHRNACWTKQDEMDAAWMRSEPENEEDVRAREEFMAERKAEIHARPGWEDKSRHLVVDEDKRWEVPEAADPMWLQTRDI